jgi:peroxiredoxin
VYGQWKQSGVKLVGIGLLDKKEAVQAFVQRHHLSFPNGYDQGGKVAKLYGFTYQPYWAVIAKDGTLLRSGFLANEGDLAAMVKTLGRR